MIRRRIMTNYNISLFIDIGKQVNRYTRRQDFKAFKIITFSDTSFTRNGKKTIITFLLHQSLVTSLLSLHISTSNLSYQDYPGMELLQSDH